MNEVARFTNREKAKEAQREVAMRQRVYPGRIEAGKLNAFDARRQINLMNEIAVDYQRLAEAEAAKERLL